MRKELNDTELNEVVGGSVVISDKMMIGFTSTGKRFYLVNCEWPEARALFRELLDNYAEKMNDPAFDAFVKNEFEKRNWLGKSF